MEEKTKKESSGIKPPAKNRIIKIILLILSLAGILAGMIVSARFLIIKAVGRYIQDRVKGKISAQKVETGFSRLRIGGILLQSPQGEDWVSIESLTIDYNLLDFLDKKKKNHAIKGVDIYRPRILLFCGTDNEWNLLSVYKHVEEKNPPPREPFHPEIAVTLREGELEFADHRFGGYQTVFTSLNALITLKTTGELLLEIDAGERGSSMKAHAEGLINSDYKGGRVDLDIESARLPFWANYVLYNDNKEDDIYFNQGLATGKVSLVCKNIYLPPNTVANIDVGGWVDVEGVSAQTRWLPDPVEALSGRVIVTKSYISLQGLKGKYRGGDFNGGGKVIGLGDYQTTYQNPRFEPGEKKNELSLDILLSVPRLDLENMKDQPILKSLPGSPRGVADLQIHITGLVSSPIVKGLVKNKRILALGEEFLNGQGTFNYFSQSLKADFKDIQWKEGKINGSIWTGFGEGDPRVILEMTGENADIGYLVQKFFPEYKIEVTSDFYVKAVGTLRDPIVMGESSFSGLKYEDFYVDEGRGDFLYGDGTLWLSELSAHYGGGVITSPSSFIDIDNKYISLMVSGRNFYWNSPSLGVSLRSDFNAHIMGSTLSPAVVGNFDNSSLCYKGYNLDNSSGILAYWGNTVSLRNVRTGLNGSPLLVNGIYIKGDHPSLAFHVQSPSLSPNSLSPVNPYFSRIPPGHTLNMTATLEGTGGKYGWNLVGQGSLGNLSALGDVNMGEGDKTGVSAYITGRDLDTDAFIPQDFSSKIQGGRADVTAMISGDGSDYNIAFLSRTPSARILGLPITFGTGRLNYNDNILTLEDSYWMGYKADKYNGDKFAVVDGLYKISSYWGFDNKSYRRPHNFARMYLQPFKLADFVYTSDGWRLKTTERVYTGLPEDRNKYVSVTGLPEIWGVRKYHQLRRWDDGGYPLSLSFEKSDKTPLGLMDNVYVADMSITGMIDYSRHSLNLNINSEYINLNTVSQDLDLTTFNLSAKDMKTTLGWKNLDGTAMIDGKVLGYWDNPRWEGKIHIYDGNINNQPFRLKGDLVADGNSVHIKSFHLDQNMGGYSGGGDITIKPWLSLNMNIKAQDASLSRLLSYTPWSKIPAKGWISGDIKIQGEPSEPIINGDLSIKDANIYGQKMELLKARVKSDTHTLTLEEMWADIGTGKLTGKGCMNGKNLDFIITADDMPLDNLNYLSDNFDEVRGTGDMKIRFSGARTSPRLEMDFATKDFSLENRPFERFEGKILWEKDQLKMDHITLETVGSYWNMAGTVEFPKKAMVYGWKKEQIHYPPVFNLQADMKNWKLEHILDIQDHPLEDTVSGVMDGSLSLQGSFPNPDLEMKVNIRSGMIGDNDFNRIDAFMTYNKGNLKLEELEYVSPESYGLLKGEINPSSGNMALEGEMKNIPVALLHPFIPQTATVQGYINSNINISGDYHRPDINSRITLDKGMMGSLKFDQIGGNINAQQGIIKLNDFGIRKDNHKIDITGTIPLEISEKGIANTDKMLINARVNDNDLGILGVFIPYLKDSKGKLKGDITLEGTYPELTLSGETSIKNGTLLFSFMENPMENIYAMVRFDSDELKVEHLKGKLGDGSFNLKGSARIEQMKVKDMNFNLTGENLTMIIPGLVRGKVDTQMTLTGDLAEPVLGQEGDHLRLKNATFTLPKKGLKDLSALLPDSQEGQPHETTASSFSLPMPVIRDFSLIIADDVWLDYSGLFIKSQGNLNLFRKTGQSLRFFGELNFSRGTLNLPFFQAPVKISDGFVRFDGGIPVKDKEGKIVDYEPNPDFSFEGETNIGDYDVFMTYRGDLDNLKEAIKPNSPVKADMDLYSIPNLSREEILELMLTSTFLGSLVNGDSRGTTSQGGTAVGSMTNYLQGLLLTPITRTFGKALSLSELNFEYYSSDKWSIKLSKALDNKDRFFITYSQKKQIQGQNVQAIWGIEYKYRPGMRLRVESDEGSLVYWLMGRVDFDNTGGFFSEIFRILTFQGGKKREINHKSNPQKEN